MVLLEFGAFKLNFKSVKYQEALKRNLNCFPLDGPNTISKLNTIKENNLKSNKGEIIYIYLTNNI